MCTWIYTSAAVHTQGELEPSQAYRPGGATAQLQASRDGHGNNALHPAVKSQSHIIPHCAHTVHRPDQLSVLQESHVSRLEQKKRERENKATMEADMQQALAEKEVIAKQVGTDYWGVHVVVLVGTALLHL